MAMNLFAEGLADAGHTVRVLAVNTHKYNIRESDIPGWYREKTRIELIGVDLRVRPWPAFLNLFTSRSYHVERFISGAFRERLATVLREESFDIIQLETLFMAPYLDVIRAETDTPVILRAHNIEHRIWQRIADTCPNPLKKMYLRHLANTLKTYELEVIRQVDGIIAITPTDADWFASHTHAHTHTPIPFHPVHPVHPDHPVHPVHPDHPVPSRPIPLITSIPFGPDPARYPTPGNDTASPTLFSIGAMNWIPNQEGIRWFLREVWPALHRELPGLEYHLAGRAMPEWMLNLRLPGLVVHGEVGNAGAFIGAHTVMIVPLFSGSGIRIKILEGMAAGKTVISTTLGAEGILCSPGSDILLADTADEFRESVRKAITNAALRETMGRQARETIAGRYHPKALIAKLAAFYEELKR